MTKAFILVVDDDALVRELIKLHLIRAGFEVVLAASGPEALLAMEDRPPALVLLDFAMPGMTGVDVLNAMRATPLTADVPAIMVTAWRADAERAMSEELGVTWMPKPVIGETLVTAVRQILG